MDACRGEQRQRPATTWLALVSVATGAFVQAGCTTGIAEYIRNGYKVGPNYHHPGAPLTQKWIDEGDPNVRLGQPNLATWWDVFDDPLLTDLVRRSYSANLTLRAARLQTLSATEQRRIAVSQLLPQTQNATASYTRSQVSGTGGVAAGGSAFFGTGLAPPGSVAPVTFPSTPISGMVDPGSGTTTTATSSGTSGSTGSAGLGGGGVSRFFDNWATSLNLSWELDFWGLFRRNVEAATANVDQSVFNSDETTVLTLAAVASKYVEIRTFQRRLELARRNVAQQEPLVAQFEQRYRAGIANSYPGYFQLKSNLENTKALIPTLEISLRDANNQLCNLLGMPVQDLLPALGDGTVPDAASPAGREVHIPRPIDYAVVVGIPAELLLERPDVKAAEQQLRIQSAEIGISEAELLPHIGINGSIGLASNQFGSLFNSQSGTGTIGPSMTWNILNYGRLLANVRLQNYTYQQFVAQYQQAILNANQDAENALTSYLRTIDQARYLRESADAAAKLTDYLIRQFKQGYLPPGSADTSAFINQIFTAINFQVTQQDAAAQAEGNVALNLILLYRAMGGGWQVRLPDGNHQCGTPPGAVPPLPWPVPGAPANAPEQLPPPKPVPATPPPGPGRVNENPPRRLVPMLLANDY